MLSTPARAVRGLDQPVGRPLRVGLGLHDRLQLVLGHHPEQAVAAEEQPVAVHQRDLVLVDVHLGLGADRAGEDVAVRMDLGLGLGDLAGLHHAVHERVVVRQLAERARAQQVRAAVPDVREPDGAPFDLRGGERGTHPAHVPVLLRPGEDRAVRLTHLLGERRVALAEERLDRLEGELRRDLAPAVTPHPVGDRVEGGLDEVRVLVALADPPDVGRDADLDLHRRSSSTVWPTRIRSPGCTIAGAARRCSFTKVPFVEPRSSTYQEPFLPNSRACCCET